MNVFSNEHKPDNFESLLTNTVIPVSYFGNSENIINQIENQQNINLNMSSSNYHQINIHQQHPQLSSPDSDNSHLINNLMLNERNQLVTGTQASQSHNSNMTLMPVDPSRIFSTIPENVNVEDCQVTSGYAVFIDVENYSKVFFIPAAASGADSSTNGT